MPKSTLPAQSRFNKLVDDISNLYVKARQAQVQFAWETGRRIVQEEQNGEVRAEYGASLLPKLSESLARKYGAGFSFSNLKKMRRFYVLHQKSSVPSQLDWTDVVELMPIKDEKIRRNLEQRVLRENLNSEQVRQLVRKVRGESVRRSPGTAQGEANGQRSLLIPKRGLLYTYRLVQRPILGGRVGDAPVQLDLGFGMYRRLTPRVAARFSADDIVTTEYDPKGESWSMHSVGAQRAAPLQERTAKDLFTYQAVIEKVIDADTLKVRIDLGFDLEHRETLRLRDIDAPEVGTKAGDAAKAFVQSILKEADTIILHTTRSDKYDRYLADVFIGENTFLNNLLIEKGYAVRM